MLSRIACEDGKTTRLQLAEAEAELKRVRARLHAIGVFLEETVPYRQNGSRWEQQADGYAAQLPWILEQLPIVWKETRPLRRSARLLHTPPSPSPSTPDATRGSRKRRRSREDDSSGQRSQQPSLRVSPESERSTSARKRRRCAGRLWHRTNLRYTLPMQDQVRIMFLIRALTQSWLLSGT